MSEECLVQHLVQQKRKGFEFLSNSKPFTLYREPAGARTLDPQIKSLLLYQLSYRFNHFNWRLMLREASRKVSPPWEIRQSFVQNETSIVEETFLALRAEEFWYNSAESSILKLFSPENQYETISVPAGSPIKLRTRRAIPSGIRLSSASNSSALPCPTKSSAGKP